MTNIEDITFLYFPPPYSCPRIRLRKGPGSGKRGTMNACVNAYEMRMPAHYVDMNKEEMEYDGGMSFGEICQWIGSICGCVDDGSNKAVRAASMLDPITAVSNLIYGLFGREAYERSIGGIEG